MIRLAALLCVFAFPVMAQDYWTLIGTNDPDDLEIRASSEGHFAEVVYDNAASLSSQSGRHVLIWRGEEIVVEIEVGGEEVNGAEIIRVTPPEHLLAVPDYAEVPDGEVFTIQIMQAMF